MTQQDPGVSNPALELYDLVKDWAIVPGQRTPLDARTPAGESYWPLHARANQLLDQIDAYLSERSTVTGRPSAGTSNMEHLRRGLNSPGGGLTTQQNADWSAISPAALEWLDTIGQSWDRSRLARHAQELADVATVASLISASLLKMEGLDPTHLDYMLTLCEALQEAARNAAIFGEGRTARLAAELVGSLQLYVPDSVASTEGHRNLVERLQRAAKHFTIYYLAPTAVQLTANPVVIQAITTGLA